MIVVTTDTVAGRAIKEHLGMVRGNTVRARHIGQDAKAFVRSAVGGEIPEYTKLMAEARQQAVGRMVNAAGELGANAVVGVRFATSRTMGGAAEFLAYGMAVTFEGED